MRPQELNNRIAADQKNADEMKATIDRLEKVVAERERACRSVEEKYARLEASIRGRQVIAKATQTDVLGGAASVDGACVLERGG